MSVLVSYSRLIYGKVFMDVGKKVTHMRKTS
jgi:hypothetical protein